MITVIMMMMTVTVMSINRLVWGRSPGAGFKMTAQCRARNTHHSFDIMSHWGQIISSSPFPSSLFSTALTASCHSALENHSQVTASLTLPPSIMLTLSLLSFSLFLTTLCALPLYLSFLSFHCISEHCPSPVSLPSESVSLFPSYTRSAPPWGNCSEPGFHFYDYNRGQNAYASRFLLACVTAAAQGRGRQIRPWGAEKITSRL